MKLSIFLFLCATFCLCVDCKLAPFIEPCREGDNACLLRSARKALPTISAGVPSLGINPLDPLALDKVMTNNAGLKMEFRNTIIKGLRNCHVVRLTRSGHHLELILKCSMMMTGDYSMSGKLLVMPIEGDGKYRIKIRDIVVKMNMEFGERRAGADRYWTVRSWRHTFNVETGAEFRFQNLFKGNKQLSDAIHHFANSNWKEIFQEVAPPMVKETTSKIVQEVAKLYDRVPLSELVLS